MIDHDPLGYSIGDSETKVPFHKIKMGRTFLFTLDEGRGNVLCMRTEGSYNNKLTNAVTFGCSAGELIHINDKTLVIPVRASIKGERIRGAI